MIEDKIDDVYYMLKAMRTYGGSFVQCLSSLIELADPVNIKKIKSTWPEYWNQYMDMGRNLERE